MPDKPLTRAELDNFRCEEPDCKTTHLRGSTPLVLRARCCDTDHVVARYNSGALTLECGTCHREVCAVQVAP